MVIQFLCKYLNRNRVSVGVYIAILTVLWSIDLLLPYLSGIYIDYLVKGIQVNWILIFVAAFALIQFIKIISECLSSILSTKLNNTMLYEIMNDQFQKIFVSEYSNYCDKDSAYYIDQIGKDSGTLVYFFSNNVVNFILQIITIIASGIIILKSDLLLSAIVFLLIPAYIITYQLNKCRMHKARKTYKEKSNEYFSKTMEQISKMAHIKRNVLQNEMQKRFFSSFSEMLRSALSMTRVDYIFSNLNQFVITIAYVSVIGIGGYKVGTGELSIGYYTIINTYFSMMIRAVTYFLGLAGTYQDSIVSTERINQIMSGENEKFGEILPDKLRAVELKDFSICYCEKQLIRTINYTFKKGILYGIKGRNGSGKTTLLNSIIGMIVGKHTGEIFYDNITMQKLDMKRMRKEKISFFEQDPVFFNMSTTEYLKFGISWNEEIEHRQADLIEKLNLTALLDKQINENGNNFSGGEKQKISLVRVLSKKSYLILLDEPTAALDKKSTERLMQILYDRKQEAIILMISHDPDALACCDALVDLDEI